MADLPEADQAFLAEYDAALSAVRREDATKSRPDARQRFKAIRAKFVDREEYGRLTEACDAILRLRSRKVLFNEGGDIEDMIAAVVRSGV